MFVHFEMLAGSRLQKEKKNKAKVAIKRPSFAPFN